MMLDLSHLLSVLGAQRSLLQLAGTVLAYEAGVGLQRRCGGSALANPVLVAVLLMAAALAVTGGSAAEDASSVQILPLLLGPATVALAVPLYRNRSRILGAAGPVLASVAAGAVVASASAVTIASALGGTDSVLRAIATKSATAAIAIAVAKEIGGDPALAAGLTVLTGMLGAVICTGVLDLVGVRDPRARGLATGVAAHGIGTARMLALDPEAGAFAGLAMGSCALATGVVVPFAAAWLHAA